MSGTNLIPVRTFSLANDPGPDAEDSGRGVPNYIITATISPDGRRLWIPSKKDNLDRGLVRDGIPLTFDSTVRTIVSQIDLISNSESLPDRLDLNDRDMAIDVLFSPLGDYVFVATQGTNKVDVLDSYSGTLVTTLNNVGLAPQGMALSSDGTRLFIHSFLSRSVLAWDVSDIIVNNGTNVNQISEIGTVANELLDGGVLLGKQIFYNADDRRMNEDGYLSCASCHLDGGSDGRVFDFTDRGEGLRNTVTLRGRAGLGHGRVHWSANFDEIQDFEHDIRGPFRGSGFMEDGDFFAGTRSQPLGDPKSGVSAELDALAAYLESLDEVPASPYRLSDGSMTEDGLAGKALFQQLDCGSCHMGPDFTDSPLDELHDVGTIKATSGNRLGGTLTGIDTPTLLGIWNDGPYLHDGSAATLLDVLTTSNPGELHGSTLSLTSIEIEQLIAYLKQVDEIEAATITPPQITGFTPATGPQGSVVEITGTGFLNVFRVDFGGVLAQTFSVDSATRIFATVPQNALAGPIRIAAPNGFVVSSSNFTLLSANVAPQVSAGIDQTVELPNPAVLDGTVTDDGLPIPPGNVITTWSMASGPATGVVTFADASSVDTTASFSIDGVYVLRLTANDGEFAPFDDITVTVNPTSSANVAPQVSAGIDQTVELPNPAILDGTVADDGLPNPPGNVTTTWGMASGPATGVVTFADALSVDTTASFSIDGVYVLRLTANDGEFAPFDEITVTVNPGGSGGGPISVQDVQSGSSTALDTVSTSQALTFGVGDLYLAAVSTKPYRPVSNVSGLGGTWTEVGSQCGARSQTGVSLWMTANANGSGPVTANLAAVPGNSVISVVRYSGASNALLRLSANTLGVDNAALCDGGIDNAAYSLDTAVSSAGSVVVGTIAIRNRDHIPGMQATELSQVAQGSGGDIAGLAIFENVAEAAGTLTLDGSFSKDVDWSMIAVEIQ